MDIRILADRKSANGNRYQLRSRARTFAHPRTFDVVIQDSYSWRYKLKGGTEQEARAKFDALTAIPQTEWPNTTSVF